MPSVEKEEKQPWLSAIRHLNKCFVKIKWQGHLKTKTIARLLQGSFKLADERQAGTLYLSGFVKHLRQDHSQKGSGKVIFHRPLSIQKEFNISIPTAGREMIKDRRVWAWRWHFSGE